MRLVVKTGSAVLSQKSGGLDREAVVRIARQAAWAQRAGHEIILVSSGAIAAGVGRLGWTERPTDLRLKQAAAAVGQLALMEAYEAAFSKDKIIPAQLLLTREDLVNRERYLNIRNTLLHLLSLGTVPIINENDSVSTTEIEFGDNDTLSAAVATKVEADKLILLSDIPGLYRQEDDGTLTQDVIAEVERVTPELEKKGSSARGSKMSTGGISAKLIAAKMATAVGIETWIASGHDENVLSRILSGAPGAGTRFVARAVKVGARNRWMAFGRTPKGTLVIDPGALRALVDEKRSLLPSGIKSVSGTFAVGETVRVKSAQGVEIARGLVNFSSDDMRKIRGHHSREIVEILGRAGSAEVIHRDNLVLL